MSKDIASWDVGFSNQLFAGAARFNLKEQWHRLKSVSLAEGNSD